jgi:homoserine dehydrogenase
VRAAKELGAVVRLVGAATLSQGKVDVRVAPVLVDCHHPLAGVEGAMNAVMLQGDAIREITLSGPGAGGIETASAVVADLVSILGSQGTGFLQNDPCWRKLEILPPGEFSSSYYIHLKVLDEPGVLAEITAALAAESVSVARLSQQPESSGARIDLVTHAAREHELQAALKTIAALPALCEPPESLRVVTERGL